MAADATAVHADRDRLPGRAEPWDALWLGARRNGGDVLRSLIARPAEAQSLGCVSVVVPLHNEAGNVLELHRRIERIMSAICRERAVARDWQIVFVNDGSSDGTGDILRRLAACSPNVHVINLRRRFGQTAALSAGMDYASGDVLITMDGDLQHLPEEIPILLAKIADGHDLVLGYRANRRDPALFRRWPSACANWLMRRMSGVTVRDFGSTFKALRREVIGEFEMFGEVHRFMPVLGAMAGCDMAEVPITAAPRRAGQSSYGLGRSFGVLIDIITLWFLSGYSTRPGRPWGYLALLLGGMGLAIQFTLAGLYFVGLIPNVFDRPGWLTLSVLLDTTGLQCLGFAAMSELLGRTYFASRRKAIYSIRSVLKPSSARVADTGAL
ncbi:MAG: glycosyltransferase family 2 protein [Phycisphaerae bacterium]